MEAGKPIKGGLYKEAEASAHKFILTTKRTPGRFSLLSNVKLRLARLSDYGSTCLDAKQSFLVSRIRDFSPAVLLLVIKLINRENCGKLRDRSYGDVYAIVQVDVDAFISEVVRETVVPIEKIIVGAFRVNNGKMDISNVSFDKTFQQVAETDVKSLVIQWIAIRGAGDYEKHVVIRFGGTDTGI